MVGRAVGRFFQPLPPELPLVTTAGREILKWLALVLMTCDHVDSVAPGTSATSVGCSEVG